MTTGNDKAPVNGYPEHDKLSAATAEAEIIGTFLVESGFILAEYRDVEGFVEQRLTPVHKSNEQIIADCFKIDLQVLAREQVRIIDTDEGKS